MNIFIHPNKIGSDNIKKANFTHCVQKKTATYVFDYNSGVSLSILIILVPMETGMNTLQYTATSAPLI